MPSPRATVRRSLAISLFLLAQALVGCATTTGTLQGFDRANFRQRRIVILRREKPVQALTLLAADKYASFAKDGISDSAVNHRLDSAFFKTLAQDIGEAKIAIDSTREASGDLVPQRFFNGYDSIQVHLRKQGLDTNDLYVVLAPILFMSATTYTPGVMRSPASSAQELSARMDWVIFDPRLDKAVAGGKIGVVSSTFAVITRIITQGDWYADARKLGGELSIQVGKLQ